jgi:hypothetical protein
MPAMDIEWVIIFQKSNNCNMRKCLFSQFTYMYRYIYSAFKNKWIYHVYTSYFCTVFLLFYTKL